MVALVALVVALATGSAAAAGGKKLVEGTVYDATCAGTLTCGTGCPPPPHCGPITAQSTADVVCLQPKRAIACPLSDSPAAVSPPICLPASGCATYPVYTEEGAVVNVRRRGSSTLIAQLPVVEGHFKIRLGPGEYVLHPYLPEEGCWSGQTTMIKIWERYKGAIPASIDVTNNCVAHPDSE